MTRRFAFSVGRSMLPLMYAAIQGLRAIRLLTLVLCLYAGLSAVVHADQDATWAELYGKGTEAYAAGDDVLATSLLKQALEVATSELEVGATYVFLGKAEFATKAPGSGTNGQAYQEKALPLLESALSKAYDPRLKHWAQWVLMKNLVELGFHYSYINSSDEALAHLRRAYDIGQELRDTRKEDAIEPTMALGGFYARKGDWSEAQALADEAWAIVQEAQLPPDAGLRIWVEDQRSKIAESRKARERTKAPSKSQQ